MNRLTLIHGLFALSAITNLALIAALASTYFSNVYFRMWVNATITPAFGTMGAVAIGIGLLVNLGIVLNSMAKKIMSKERTIQSRMITPLELIAQRNPTLATDGMEN